MDLILKPTSGTIILNGTKWNREALKKQEHLLKVKKACELAQIRDEIHRLLKSYNFEASTIMPEASIFLTKQFAITDR